MNNIKYKLIGKQKMSQLNVASLRTFESDLYASFDFRIMNLCRKYINFLRNRRIIKSTIKHTNE